MSDRNFTAPPRQPLVAAAAFAVLALLAALGIADVQPPAPRGPGAPAGQFSAGRAFGHVERIGQEVHVTGGQANDRVRDHLLSTLTGYGLQPQVQDTIGVNAGKFGHGGMARVRNVVAVLPGTGSTGRLVLMAHYDSVQVSYGANDDGAGVSTLLEVARTMAAGPRPRNDVVFLFTDAEEACLCGAEAFVSQHPLGRDRAVVLNFEARGSRGPVVMFQTSQGNAALVDVFAGTPHPVGTSLAVEVYRLLSNDTDFTAFLAKERFTGLNAAYIDGSYAYHSPLDRPSTMDRASLQHHGDNALALTRALGTADLGPLMRPAASDATYFPIAGLLARYPAWMIWPLALLALLAVAALTLLARRRGLTSWPRTLAGLGLALAPLVAAAVVVQLLWMLLMVARPGYGELLDPNRPTWFRFGAVAFTLAVLLGWYGSCRRRLGPVPLATGALGLLAVLGAVCAAVVPGGSYLVALPALAGALAGIAALHLRQPLARVAVQVVGAGLAVLILAPTVALFFPAMGMRTGAAPAMLTMLLGLAALPVLELLFRPARLPRHRLLGAAPATVALVAALVCTVAGYAVDRWDARHPEPTHLMYLQDTDERSAQWVSIESSPSAWTARYVTSRTGGLSDRVPVLPSGELTTGPARYADLPAPQLTVLSDSTADGVRTLRLRLTPKRPVRLVALNGPDLTGKVLRVNVEGRELDPVDGEPFHIEFHGPPADGIAVTLVVPGGLGPLRLGAIDGSDGLDGLPGFEPRPADVGVLGSHSSELVAVTKQYTI